MKKRKYINRLRRFLCEHRRILNGTVGEYLLAGLFFVILSLLYTNFSAIDGDYRLFITEPGDATAGVTWAAGADKDLNPASGHTDIVNYPQGVELANPAQITGVMISFPLWLLSRVFSPYMATNLMQIIAFLLMSMTMYAILKRMTGKWYIALFGGYAATFFPYHIFKSVNHIGNIFSWVFALELAAFLNMWRRPSVKASLLVAVSIAAGYFTDGYYLLISSVTAVVFAVAIVASSLLLREGRAKLVALVKHLLLAVATLVVFALPIVFTQLAAGDGVNKTLDRSLSTIKAELKVYATYKLDFLTPPPDNPYFHGQYWYDESLREKSGRSNPVESTLYIGYVILLLCAIGLIVFGLSLFKKKYVLRKGRLTERDYRLLVVMSVMVLVSVPVFLSFMGPDRIYRFGLAIPTLAGILTDHISLWRVLARFILPLHVLLVAYAMFSLYLILKATVAWRRDGVILSMVIVGALGGVCAVEYATTQNTPVFDVRNMPRLYSFLRDRQDIHAIAELPLTDSPVEINGYYATAQYIHGKKLINNHVSQYNKGQFSALGDEKNPETIDFVRERGADAIITREKACAPRDWGELIYTEKIDLKSPYDKPPFYEQSGNNYMCLYKLSPAGALDQSFLTTSASFSRQNTGEYTTSLGTMKAELKVEDSKQQAIKGRRALIQIDMLSTGKLAYKWKLVQREHEVAAGESVGGGKHLITGIIDTDHPASLEFSLVDSRIKYTPEDIRLLNYRSTLQ